MTVVDHKSKISNSKSNKPQGSSKSMAELLALHRSPFVTLHKGDIIEGTITKLSSFAVLVDVNAKAEAVVLEKDKKILHNILSSLLVGDKVNVQILNPESDMGNPVVSLRRFLDSKLWTKLEELSKSKKAIDVTVDDVIKGGLLVTGDGISGFLPNSQLSFASHTETQGSTQNIIGSKIKAIVLEVDRGTHKIIFSQSHVLNQEDFEKEIKGLKTGQKIAATVTNVTPYGIFVSVPNGQRFIDGFMHISEISWERVSDTSSLYNIGDSIEAAITGFDKEARRVNVSIKKLKIDPFDEKIKNFSVDKKLSATVTKILSMGVSLDLGDEIGGFIRKEKIPPTVSYKAGDVVNVTVSEIDLKRKRVMVVPVLLEKPIGYR